MNILLLNYEYPPLGGGGAIVTKELCQELDKHGNHVEVITMGFNGLPNKEQHGNIIIHRVKCWRRKQRVCHPWEQLSYCIRAYLYIRKNIDIKKYHFIHCHFIIPTGLLAMWVKKKYGIEYIVTAHGSDVIGHNNARFSTLYKVITPLWKKILKNAYAVTAPSEYLVDKIHKTTLNIPVELIPNGINTCEYIPKTKIKSIITLTRLQESKGVQDLIEVCSTLDMQGWEINILGDGPYRSSLEELVEKKKMKDIVHFKGHVEGEEKMQYLSEAGCFFSGSRFESFSVSVLEASLCGCNIIASAITPHINLVGKDHIYKNADELRNMIINVISNEPKALYYGNEKYDWENIYNLYDKQYRKIMQCVKD